MRHFMNIRVALVVLCATVFIASPLLAQEWSAAQKEVWKNVETYNDLWAKRDLEGFLGYFHTDYSGWFNRASLPGSKASIRKWVGHSFKTWRISVYEVNPVAIKIHGNVAIAHYYYSFIRKDADGKESNRSGRSPIAVWGGVETRKPRPNGQGFFFLGRTILPTSATTSS